jgi:S-adenosylmethionine/arginine decarboxylase-like enzyme
MKIYGYELVLDLVECNPETFNRERIDKFFTDVCEVADVKKEEQYWWDDSETPKGEEQTDPKTTGTSAIQFILQSDIRIHTLDKLKVVYINFFSCKPYVPDRIKSLAIGHFQGLVANYHYFARVM